MVFLFELNHAGYCWIKIKVRWSKERSEMKILGMPHWLFDNESKQPLHGAN